MDRIKEPTAYELIVWIDSTSQPGWGEYEDREDDMVCKTVGIFYKEDDVSVVLAMNWSPHNYGEYMRIPKVCIKSRTVLEIRCD